MTTSGLRALAMAAIVLLLVPAVALATRAPTKRERDAITRAVKGSSATRIYPDSQYGVYRIRISTRGPYAKSYIEGVRGFKSLVQPAYVVLRRANGRWRLKNIGGTDLGCGVPDDVQRELRVDCGG